jgi:hypothetical protein
MNIILKSFEFCQRPLERAFQGKKFGTCISILDDEFHMPNLEAAEHIWVSARNLRDGKYPDVNWNEITPLDAELIEAMRHSEAVFMRMIERYTAARDFSYGERRQKYMDHLRYWNHILETKKIDLLLLNHIPHQTYDYVLYNLCKLKGIPTLHLERFSLTDSMFVEEDWKGGAKELKTTYERLKKEYADTSMPIPLSPKYDQYFLSQTERDEKPWYMGKNDNRPPKVSFVSKWGKRSIRALTKKPAKFFSAVISPAAWSRKWSQHKITRVYDRYVKEPDLSKPYIYVPLHYQPEATTCPMAGVYSDQELIVELLAACLPPGIQLYVKEHPAQGELCRTEEFYKSIHRIPSVTCVPKDVSTFELIRKSIAVVTATGTPGFEALFREKPVLMFGYRCFQYAPGIFMIRNREDCEHALDRIINQKQAPTKRDMRIFLKAMEECSVETYVGIHNPNSPFTKEEQANIMGDYIKKRLHAALPNFA